MSKTILGIFDETYHHIDAPTHEDKEHGAKYHTRTLIADACILEDYTNPAFYYLQHNDWVATRKMDGTNIRIKWDGEQAIVAGKTNKANFTSLGDVFTKYINEHFLEERFEEKFGRDKTVIIFGEWVGKKVQLNELNLDGNELVIFDVQVNGIWLDFTSVSDVADFFDCPTPIHYMDDGVIVDQLDQLIYDVADGKYKDWEGLVAEPVGQFRDKSGKRIICKIKNRDYYDNKSK